MNCNRNCCGCSRCRPCPPPRPPWAPSIKIGTVTTLPPGSYAYVDNVGTDCEAVFNFGIPAGAAGADGETVTVTASACECNCRAYAMFPLTSAELGNNSLITMSTGTATPSTFTLNADGTQITIPAGCIYTVSCSVTGTGTTSLGIVPVINGTANDAYAQYSQVNATTDNASVAAAFPVSADAATTVSFRVVMPSQDGATLSGIITVTGIGALV